MQITSQRGFGALGIIIAVAVVILLGVTTTAAHRANQKANLNKTATPAPNQTRPPAPSLDQPHPSQALTDSKPRPETFDAGQFYSLVQNGMSYDQVTNLAGKKGDCSTTGVYPASSYTSCTWQNSRLSVTVRFEGDQVVAKSSRDL